MMTRVGKPAKQRKWVIFSNLNPGSNCHEDCRGRGDCDCDYIALEDERVNLNYEVDGRILAIADLGLWNGRCSGYRIYGRNIRDILYTDCGFAEWYSDGHNIKSTQIHHDGRNYIEYRVIREDRNVDLLLSKLYRGEEVTRAMINYYTKSLHPYVAGIYGWR